MEFISLDFYKIFITLETHGDYCPRHLNQKLNKTNNFEIDFKLIDSWKEKKQISFEIVHQLLVKYLSSIE